MTAAASQWRMMTTRTWERGVGERFFGGHPPPTLGRAFWEEEDDNEGEETSRDDKHEEDVVMRSMFETLCEGKPSSSLSTARPKRRSSAAIAARASGADPSQTKRSRTGQRGRWRRRNGACVSDANDYERLLYIQRRDDTHNNITFNNKHIMSLIFCN